MNHVKLQSSLFSYSQNMGAGRQANFVINNTTE